MRSQCSLYVDAGYLLASVATRLTGTSLRSGVRVDYERLIACLTKQAESIAGVPLLRVNWYDAAKNALPDPDQQRIGSLPRVKVRLGRVGFNGEQKGVDLRIGLDMVAQARNGAVDVIFLVSGDDDLTEAVEEAQVHGVQVIVLAIPDKLGGAHGVSEHLQRASDGVELIEPEGLDKAVNRTAAVMVQHAMPRPGPRPAPPATPPPSPILLARRPGPSITAPLIDAGLPVPTAPTVPDVPEPDKDAELSLAYRS
ncbi:MAG: NYN domain-containing protein, partial [Bifidobacteriaceae bacterium]|nr:NYN domain-containing protein [Bifidobacteriaceae bacterium]